MIHRGHRFLLSHLPLELFIKREDGAFRVVVDIASPPSARLEGVWLLVLDGLARY